jgi:hypothetical protein
MTAVFDKAELRPEYRELVSRIAGKASHHTDKQRGAGAM